MVRASLGALVGLLLLAASPLGCGSRTGLDPSSGDGRDGPGASGSPAGPPAEPGTPTSAPASYCAENLGPVSDCEQTTETGPVGACSSDFPRCIQPPLVHSGWECCSSTGPINGPDGCPGPSVRCPFIRYSIPPQSGVMYQCLRSPLFASVPDWHCVVVEARLPTGSADSAHVAACARCDDPGLEPLVSEPSWVISPQLQGYDCLCLVQGQPAGTGVGGLECTTNAGVQSESPFWCLPYNPGAASQCAGVGIQVPAEDGPLFVACFDDEYW